MLYTSVDEPVFKPIIAEFEAKTGVKVVVQSDTEATKSAGLAARLEAERDKPRAERLRKVLADVPPTQKPS